MFFPPFVTFQDFLVKDSALSLSYSYGALTSCKKLEKTNEQSLRYLKVDQQTDGQGQLLRTPLENPGYKKKGRCSDLKCMESK